MTSTLKNVSIAFWLYFIPVTSILTLEFLLYIPRSSEFLSLLRAAPFYAGIYYWCVVRPDSFKFLSAFILGIFADVIGGTPLGINIITYLIMFLLSTRLTAYFNLQKFSYSWLLFMMITLFTMLFKALLVGAFYRAFIPLRLFVFEFLLTIMLYPLLVRFYTFIEHRFIHLEERYEKN